MKHLLLSLSLLTFVGQLNAQVSQAWVQRFGGTGTDYPTKMINDASGNVYITGSQAAPSGSDAVVKKYNSAGTLQWTATYNSPDNRDDYGQSITRDALGNIYITGSSFMPGGYRALTIKYNASGIQQWVSLFNPAGHIGSQGLAITTDASGNVYVAGHADPFGGYLDNYCTLKYNAAGVLLWSQFYNGTADGLDQAKFIKVDNSGNVVVTGESMGTIRRRIPGRDGSITIVTVKTLLDIATVKYNSSGIQQWAVRFNGSGNGNDQPNGIVTDSIGNIFITGSATTSGGVTTMITMKYDFTGYNTWTVLRPGVSFSVGGDIARDAAGNLIVTGTTSTGPYASDLLVVRYTASGTEVWANIFNGGLNDGGTAVVLDGSGNAYVTGTTIRQSAPNIQSSDFITCKFNTSGGLLWSIRYNGPANLSDMPVSIGIYNSSIIAFTQPSIYVAGSDNGIGTGSDWAVVKYTQPSTICCVASKMASTIETDDGPHQFRIDNFPNPFRGTTNLQYEIPQQGKVSISVFDLYGRLLTSFDEGNQSPGVHRKFFDASKLAKGLYQYKLVLKSSGGEFTQTKQMSVQ